MRYVFWVTVLIAVAVGTCQNDTLAADIKGLIRTQGDMCLYMRDLPMVVITEN